MMVDVRYVRHTKRILSLGKLKEHAALAEMVLLRKGNRLSIIPLRAAEMVLYLESGIAIRVSGGIRVGLGFQDVNSFLQLSMT